MYVMHVCANLVLTLHVRYNFTTLLSVVVKGRRGAVGCTTDSLCGGRGFEPQAKAPVVSLSKKLYPCCFVLVGSRNGFERDFTIELK